MVKMGQRKPNINKRISARTTGKITRKAKSTINPLYGKKGMGLVKNPKKAVYNKIYNKTTFDIFDGESIEGVFGVIPILFFLVPLSYLLINNASGGWLILGWILSIFTIMTTLAFAAILILYFVQSPTLSTIIAFLFNLLFYGIFSLFTDASLKYFLPTLIYFLFGTLTRSFMIRKYK